MDMKKMFAVSTVALCATVSLAELASANIVGYASKEAGSTPYHTAGAMFVTVGAEGTWKLGDLKMIVNGKDGGAYGDNKIQFLDPATSKIDRDKIYTYYGVEDDAVAGEDDGWYTVSDDDDKNDIYSNDVSFPAGTAFLCNFLTRYNTSLQFSGQVVTGDLTIDSKVEGIEVPYMYVLNPYPTAITLGDIKMIVNGKDGGAYGDNKIQFLDPATSKIDRDKIYTYYGVQDDAVAGEDDGWYTVNDDDDKNDIYSNDVTLGAGDGFLCNFLPRYTTQLKFVSPIK